MQAILSRTYRNLTGVRFVYLPRVGSGLHIALQGKTPPFVLATFILLLPTIFPRDDEVVIVKICFGIRTRIKWANYRRIDGEWYKFTCLTDVHCAKMLLLEKR